MWIRRLMLAWGSKHSGRVPAPRLSSRQVREDVDRQATRRR